MTAARDTKRGERILARLVAVGLGLALLMSFAGIFLLTLGFDEAWILLGIDGIVHPQAGEWAVAPVVTSGGVFALVQLGISAMAGNTLWAHRLFVFACLVGTVWMIMRWVRRHDGSVVGALIVPCVLIGIPGTLVFGATGYATLPAFLLMLWVVELWEASAERRWVRWVVCGSLAGLVAATRLEMAMLLPALVIASWWGGEGRRARVMDAVIAALVGGCVLAASVAALSHAAARSAALDTATVSSMTGVTGAFLDYPKLLNKWMIGESFMSPALLVLATLVGWRVARGREGLIGWGCTILIVCGWLLWLGWLTRSPIPHLRYLWPALACFAVVLGLGLARLHGWGVARDEPVARVAALVLALACILTGMGSTLRDLAHGEGNILSWEWSRETPAHYFRRFQHVQDQRAAATYLREHSSGEETIGVLGLDMELRYLTGRHLISLQNLGRGARWKDVERLPRRLVLTPMVGSYMYLSAEGYRWVESNCVLEAQFGGYCFYRVTGSYPSDPKVLRMNVVQQPPAPLARPAWGG